MFFRAFVVVMLLFSFGEGMWQKYSVGEVHWSNTVAFLLWSMMALCEIAKLKSSKTIVIDSEAKLAAYYDGIENEVRSGNSSITIDIKVGRTVEQKNKTGGSREKSVSSGWTKVEVAWDEEQDEFTCTASGCKVHRSHRLVNAIGKLQQELMESFAKSEESKT